MHSAVLACKQPCCAECLQRYSAESATAAFCKYENGFGHEMQLLSYSFDMKRSIRTNQQMTIVSMNSGSQARALAALHSAKPAPKLHRDQHESDALRASITLATTYLNTSTYLPTRS